MKSKDILLYGGLAAAGYLLFKSMQSSSSTTAQQNSLLAQQQAPSNFQTGANLVSNLAQQFGSGS